MTARFYLPGADIRDGVSTLVGPEFDHLRRVLRLGVGDKVDLFDGTGWEYAGIIEAMMPDRAIVKIAESRRPERESPLKITLAMGLTKGEKLDFIVEKTTELGVHALIAFTSSRTVPQLDERKMTKRVDRWRKIALSAAKQCGRTKIPVIGSPVQFNDLVEQAAAGAVKIVFWEEETTRSLRELHAALPQTEEVYLIVGPEGGLSADEAAVAQQHGFHTAHLGRRILRAETAAVSVVALTQFLWGDLG